MKISTLIQGLSIATVLLVAGRPAYGASFYLTVPKEIVGNPGDTINFSSIIDTTGLTTDLESLTLIATFDSNEIVGLDSQRADTRFLPDFSRQVSVDTNTGLTTLIPVVSGLPGLPPNFNYKLNDVTITLGSQVNNDGKADFSFYVLSAIDVSGRDVTDQFGAPPPGKGVQEFEVQPAPVPEPSTIFGLVLTGGFGAFLRKQNRKVQA